MYSKASERNEPQAFLLLTRRADLNPLAHGLRELKMSKRRSNTQMDFTVTADPLNCFSLSTPEQYSMAMATLELTA